MDRIIFILKILEIEMEEEEKNETITGEIRWKHETNKDIWHKKLWRRQT